MKTISVEKINELSGHRNAIYNLCPGDLASTIFSSGSDRFVARWNIHSGEGETISKTESPVYGLRYDPVSGLLLIGLSDGGIHFISPEDHSVLKSSKVHDKGVFEFVFLGDGQVLASSEDGSLSLWDLKSLDAKSRLKLSHKSIRTISRDPSSGNIAVGSSDNKIYVLDPELKVIREWEAHSLSIFRTIWSPSNGLLISTGRDAQIKVWDPKQDFREILSIPAHMYAINDLIFDPTGDLLISGSMDKSIRIWDAQTFKLLKVIDKEKHDCHPNGVNRLLYHEGVLLSCGDDRKIMTWKINW